MSRDHQYSVQVTWTGQQGAGTTSYRAYARDHQVSVDGKPMILGSSDPAFRGDPGRWTPEDLLVAALSQCHMLWFLHLAAEAGVVVTDYVDVAVGTMQEHRDGGEFTRVVLRPVVTVAEEAMITAAEGLHERAHEMCFIARSVNFPVDHEPVCQVLGDRPMADGQQTSISSAGRAHRP